VKSNTTVCQDKLGCRVYDGCAAERSLALLDSCYIYGYPPWQTPLPQKSANQESANLYETIGDGDARNKRARTVLMPLRSLKPVIYRDTESVDAVSRR
jgi:hypothetical protein